MGRGGWNGSAGWVGGEGVKVYYNGGAGESVYFDVRSSAGPGRGHPIVSLRSRFRSRTPRPPAAMADRAVSDRSDRRWNMFFTIFRVPSRQRHDHARLFLRDAAGFVIGVRCYWCGYWCDCEWDPYVEERVDRYRCIDWIGRPLCEYCEDWHLGEGIYAEHPQVLAADSAGLDWFGEPYEPTAITRAALLLQRWFEHRASGVHNGNAMVEAYRPPVSLEISRLVSSFLLPWHAP